MFFGCICTFNSSSSKILTNFVDHLDSERSVDLKFLASEMFAIFHFAEIQVVFLGATEKFTDERARMPYFATSNPPSRIPRKRVPIVLRDRTMLCFLGIQGEFDQRLD